MTILVLISAKSALEFHAFSTKSRSQPWTTSDQPPISYNKYNAAPTVPIHIETCHFIGYDYLSSPADVPLDQINRMLHFLRVTKKLRYFDLSNK